MNAPLPPPRTIRWWPGILIGAAAAVIILVVRAQADWPFQKRNLTSFQVGVLAFIALVLWWTFFSRAPGRLRLRVTGAVLAVIVIFFALFRLQGMSGDMRPIFEFRWARTSVGLPASGITPSPLTGAFTNAPGFPQFLGPDRNSVLTGPRLATNWSTRPPAILWRIELGAAWSGFSIAGGRAFTQEQRGESECVAAYDVRTGKLIWLHRDQARYATAIGGEGPRATPTIVDDRVVTHGTRGRLNCLDAATGRLIWTRDALADAGAKVPDWGCASSPLVFDGRVVINAGARAKNSLLAYELADGRPAWSAGTAEAGYGSPALVTLAGHRQMLAFNDGVITAHDATSGKVLWEKPWGNGNVVAAAPVVVGENRVVFSSGYGVGSELLEVITNHTGRLRARVVWESKRLKAKFHNPYTRDGFLYGLDDGILACVDLRDGSQRWKEGRYGHGQGLLVGEHYLLMSEPGELILLQPTPDAPNEIARFRVFNAKTWNPIALAGDLLLVRNDREAACIRLPLAP